MAIMGLYVNHWYYWYFADWNGYIRVVRILCLFDRAPTTVEVVTPARRRREVLIHPETEEWRSLLALLREYRRTAGNLNATQRGALEKLMANMGSFYRLTQLRRKQLVGGTN